MTKLSLQQKNKIISQNKRERRKNVKEREFEISKLNGIQKLEYGIEILEERIKNVESDLKENFKGNMVLENKLNNMKLVLKEKKKEKDELSLKEREENKNDDIL